MLKTAGVILVLLMPCIARPQEPQKTESSEAQDPCTVFLTESSPGGAPSAEQAKKKDKDKGRLVPLSVVVCEVEQALDAYQQSEQVAKKDLPGLATADFDFKTVVDTKASMGVTFFIFTVSVSHEKQATNEVDFQYEPKSRVPGIRALAIPKTFQQELTDTILAAAKAVKEQRRVPSHAHDPLVFKKLEVTLSYGVTWDVSGGVSAPISVVTLTPGLDRSKNNVQSVTLRFEDPEKPRERMPD